MKKAFSAIILTILLCGSFSTAAQAYVEWLPFFMLAMSDSEASAAQEKEVDPDVAMINRLSERFIPLDDKYLISDKDNKYIFTSVQKNKIIEEYASYIPQIKMKAKADAESADFTRGIFKNPILLGISFIALLFSFLMMPFFNTSRVVKNFILIVFLLSIFYVAMHSAIGCLPCSNEIKALRENEAVYSTIAIEKIYQESTTHTTNRNEEIKDAGK